MSKTVQTEEVRTSPPVVSIILTAYNHLDYTKQCVESMFAHTNDDSYELITINNG